MEDVMAKSKTPSVEAQADDQGEDEQEPVEQPEQEGDDWREDYPAARRDRQRVTT
jgi:hypothetical protein